MGHSDGALLALMAAAAASRMTKDEPPHVVIDVHASNPVQRGPTEARAAAQQQGAQQTTGPLPVVLDSQQASGVAVQRYVFLLPSLAAVLSSCNMRFLCVSVRSLMV